MPGSRNNTTNSSRARVEMEMRESLERTAQMVSRNRPVNTSRAYEPKIAEFRRWCDLKFSHLAPETRYTVSGEKAHLFLEEAVKGRAPRKRRAGNSEENCGENSAETPRKIRFATLSLYGAALVYLWRQQKLMNVNSHSNPRDVFGDLLDAAKEEEEEIRKENYVDRGIGTIMDGYTTTDQIVALVNFYFNKNDTNNLRNALAFLLSHFCLLRGESARKAELPDLQVVNLEGEGSTRCPALILIMRQGKTNKFGRLELGACIRNKKVEICPIMMLGVYLFARFHFDNEPFPNFTKSENWFDIKILKHKNNDATAEWPYKSHLTAIDNAFKACGITSSKKTHVSRGAAARMADLQGVPESDIRRMGRWNNSSMNGAYLTGLPRGIMRALAGFPVEQSGAFFLARDTFLPSEDLQAKVFPEASEWINRIHSGTAEKTVAAEGFLTLLLTLRITFLQDSIFMQQKFPNHPIWKHSLFLDPMYLEFKRSLETTAESEANEESLLIRRAIPFIERQLANINDRQQEGHERLSQQVEDLKRSIGDISSGRVPLQININWPENSNLPMTTVQPILSTTDTNLSPTNVSESVAAAHNVQTSTNISSTYRLSRGLTTITDLYREWSEGLGGNHSVEYMNAHHPGWYKNDKTFYMRRRRIIAEIKRFAEVDGMSILDAVRHAESLRVRNEKTIDFLGKNPKMIFHTN